MLPFGLRIDIILSLSILTAIPGTVSQHMESCGIMDFPLLVVQSSNPERVLINRNTQK